MRQVELAAVDNVVGRAMPVVAGVVGRLLVVACLGLVAVLMCVGTARTIVRQLLGLRDAADKLANQSLPQVVARLSAGERVDPADQAPPLDLSGGELGALAAAFNAVQQTALAAAVGQAEIRFKVRDVFLALARRQQGLVDRQLRLLDAVERRVTDEHTTAELYHLDHLATRMRRTAENLIVLSGAGTGRTWREAMPLVDVVRGAISEVEDYQRVQLQPLDGVHLDGRAAGDMIHLLAELIDNATRFSPPFSPVTIAGHRVAHGFVLEIEDGGLGMSADDLEAFNARLQDPPSFDAVDVSHLGLYVVAQLARRYGIQVTMRASAYGGICAVALIPEALLQHDLPAPQPTGSAPVPQPRQQATAGAAPITPATSSDLGRPGPGAESEDGGPRPDGLPAGLPWRRRQPVPQPTPTPTTTGTAGAPSPEQRAARIAALYEGTRQGRAVRAAPVPAGTANDQHTASTPLEG
jgi:signal transduction histidine kinase